jgi:hypothetical protein
MPQRVLGDQDTPGLPSSEWLRNKILTLYAIPATVRFRYYLGCGSEADVRCADDATLLHRGLHFVRT